MNRAQILKPVILVLVVYSIFTADLLILLQGDISCFVHAGKNYVDAGLKPRELCLRDGGDGYDGQFFYRFALSPFSNKPVEHGISIDVPRYRYQRIFYSLLTWGMTAGSPALVPYALVFINLVSIAVLTALAAGFAVSLGRSSYWSLLVGLYPGFLIAYALDLNQILEMMLLFGAFLLLRRKDGLAVFLLSCAVLTRETALLFALAILLTALYQRWASRFVYLIPMAVFAAWQVFVAWFWRAFPNAAVGEQVGMPFSGFITAFRYQLAAGDWFAITLLLIVLLFGLAVLFSLRASSVSLSIKLAWLLYAALTAAMTANVWVKFNGYLRGISEWYILSWLVILPLIKLPAFQRAVKHQAQKTVEIKR